MGIWQLYARFRRGIFDVKDVVNLSNTEVISLADDADEAAGDTVTFRQEYDITDPGELQSAIHQMRRLGGILRSSRAA